MASLSVILNEATTTVVATNAAVPTTLYTLAANTRLIITSIRIINIDTVEVGFDMWRIPNGQAVADKYRIFDRQHAILEAGETIFLGPDELKEILAVAGDVIAAAGSVASKIMITMYGYSIDTS